MQSSYRYAYECLFCCLGTRFRHPWAHPYTILVDARQHTRSRTNTRSSHRLTGIRKVDYDPYRLAPSGSPGAARDAVVQDGVAFGGQCLAVGLPSRVLPATAARPTRQRRRLLSRGHATRARKPSSTHWTTVRLQPLGLQVCLGHRNTTQGQALALHPNFLLAIELRTLTDFQSPGHTHTQREFPRCVTLMQSGYRCAYACLFCCLGTRIRHS